MSKRKATSELNHMNWDDDDVQLVTRKRVNNTITSLTPTTVNTSAELDLKTQRSKHFLTEIASLNRDLAEWLSASIRDNAEVLLTRVFLDHQRHVQRLFDEERKREMSEEERRILANQEKVLHMLTESTSTLPSVSIPVTSNGTHHTSIVTQATNQLSTQKTPFKAIEFTRSYNLESAEKSDALRHNTDERLTVTPVFVNPFFSNGTSALNNGLVSADNCMVNPFLQQKSGDEAMTSMRVGTCTSSMPAVSSQYISSMPAVSSHLISSMPAVSSHLISNMPAVSTVVEDTDEDEPPKVEHIPVQEDGAIYTKRCKVFFKKESGEGFEDRGVANLFLKPVTDSARTQLIVRSDTSLGTVIVNVILTRDVPVKKLNATNVMLVCVPTVGATLRTVLLRVKSGVDCEELVGKLGECQGDK